MVRVQDGLRATYVWAGGDPSDRFAGLRLSARGTCRTTGPPFPSVHRFALGGRQGSNSAGPCDRTPILTFPRHPVFTGGARPEFSGPWHRAPKDMHDGERGSRAYLAPESKSPGSALWADSTFAASPVPGPCRSRESLQTGILASHKRLIIPHEIKVRARRRATCRSRNPGEHLPQRVEQVTGNPGSRSGRSPSSRGTIPE